LTKKELKTIQQSNSDPQNPIHSNNQLQFFMLPVHAKLATLIPSLNVETVKSNFQHFHDTNDMDLVADYVVFLAVLCNALTFH